ncbi:NAD(P)/FAD-dependent oxidoreductase [Aureimonas psammosilenae]|uniref:NAD(P)/FAD-dependent oxidoreductase n=1 Tax=Aureimonas psammosilenae TaxID=2495496 RepID=UPI0012612225|nr:NAD(P)/FAD-dependent oxidoreductase [Aureimonas psammosilenae]
MSDFDAVVIGAGPAGSTVAAGLARAGWRVALLERSAFPRSKVCGEFMSATSAAVLDRIGVGEAWRAEAGPPVRRLGLYRGETIVEAPAPGQGAADGFGRALGRDRLDPMLLQTAIEAGATVIQPAKASSFERKGDEARIHFATPNGEESLTTRVTIAAHGSWEPGPLPSHMAKSHGPGDYLGFKAYFRDAHLPEDLLPLLAFPGGYGGLVTADNGRVSLSLCIRRDVLETLRADSGSASAAQTVHAHLLASCRGVREAIGGARLDGSWLAAGPIRPGIRPRFADGVLRVGNAAGEAHPIIAEGISMAVQSGWLAADALSRTDPARPDTLAQAIERYSESWHRQFATRIRAANAFRIVGAGPRTAAVVERAIRLAPGLLGLGARLGGKTRPI